METFISLSLGYFFRVWFLWIVPPSNMFTLHFNGWIFKEIWKQSKGGHVCSFLSFNPSFEFLKIFLFVQELKLEHCEKKFINNKCHSVFSLLSLSSLTVFLWNQLTLWFSLFADALEMASQHELNPSLLRCNLCSYATSFVGALKRHLRTWHINKSPPIPPRPGYPWPSTCGMDNVGRFQSMVLPVTQLQGAGEPDVMITSDNTEGNPGMLEAISIFETKENEGDSSSIRGQHPDSLIRDFKCLLPDTEERDPCIEAVCSEDVQNTVMVMSTDDSENSPKVLLLCRFCNKSFRSRLGLKLHIDSKHLGKFQYKCKICGKGFTNLWNYRNHLSTHSLTPSEKCENCGAVFQFKISLQEHQQTCLPRTSAPTELVEVKEEASSRMYSCHMCGRLFKWRSSLKYHRDKGCIVKRFSQGLQ